MLDRNDKLNSIINDINLLILLSGGVLVYVLFTIYYWQADYRTAMSCVAACPIGLYFLNKRLKELRKEK